LHARVQLHPLARRQLVARRAALGAVGVHQLPHDLDLHVLGQRRGVFPRLLEQLRGLLGLIGAVVRARERERKGDLPVGILRPKGPHRVANCLHRREQVLEAARAQQRSRGLPVHQRGVVDEEGVACVALRDREPAHGEVERLERLVDEPVALAPNRAARDERRTREERAREELARGGAPAEEDLNVSS